MVENLFLERIGLSSDKEKLRLAVNNKNIIEPSDNPPVGIILCTANEKEKVHYATAGLDNKMFVSKYLIELPKEEDLIRLVRS